MSFRDWLTPDASLLSNPLDCRKISVPGDLWLYVQGALEELTKEYNWEQFGTATPYETSQFWMDILDEFSESQCGGGMVWLASPITVFNQSGSGDFTTQVQVLKATYTQITDAVGLVVSIRSGNDAIGVITGFQFGSASNQIQLSLPVADNYYQQVIIPCDGVGSKVNIQVFDNSYYNYLIRVHGYVS